mgnify:CR=1 FL=1
MHKLTYTNEKGYPVNLVFDSKEEAEKWGVIYSRRSGGTYHILTVYTVS